jgi:hypothetical protein
MASSSSAPLSVDPAREVFNSFFYYDGRLSFSPSKPLVLQETIDPTELQNRKRAIEGLIKAFKYQVVYVDIEEDNQNISNLITQAFQLSAADIQKKSPVIQHMAFSFFGSRSMWGMGQGFLFGQVAPFIEKFLLSSLNEDQIENRTIQIADNSHLLLGDAIDKNFDIVRNAFRFMEGKSDERKRLIKSRSEMISSLFDFGTEQIANRASIMRKYFEDKIMGYHLEPSSGLTGRTYSEILRNASSLDNRTLESRLGIIKSQLETLKLLAGVTDERKTLNETIISQEFSAYAAGLKLNNEDLVNRFNGIKDLFTPKTAEPINNFMDFLNSYKTFIPLPSDGTAVEPSSSSTP